MRASHAARRSGVGGRVLAWTAALAAALAAGAAPAQAPHPTTTSESVPPLPSGTATIRGTVIDARNPGATGGLTVALYALQPDGTPGLARGETDAEGSFRFGGISGSPDIVYLVGVRYREVPFGERLAFVPGQLEIDVELPVSTPTAEGRGLRTLDTRIRVEWLGTRLAIQERQRLLNPGDAAVFVTPPARAHARAPFETVLPAGAMEFQTPLFNGGDAFEQHGRQLRYWGPIYPGEQELSYGYLVPAVPGPDSDSIALELSFPRGTGGLELEAPASGPELEVTGTGDFRPGESEVDGRAFRVLEGGALAPGATLTLAVRVPETTDDTTALSLAASEVQAELDDTVLEVTQQHRLEVAPGAHLAGRPGAPLLRFALPPGARLVGLSVDAADLGASGSDEAVDVLGPLGPGSHDLAFRYRLDAGAHGTELALRFPLVVPNLLLRVADTGVRIDTDRLHRLRPQVAGTRTWLLREAFQVEPDETVLVRLSPLERTPVPRAASAGLVFAAAAGAMLFVLRPLRRDASPPAGEARETPLHRERELVYATIRDLEHDFETGKVAEADYHRTRSELRARAIELLRAEQAEPAEPEGAARPATPASPARPSGGFCPACGAGTEAAWRFCSHCGGALPRGESASG